MRSAEALAALKNAGFADARHVAGGVVGWVNRSTRRCRCTRRAERRRRRGRPLCVAAQDAQLVPLGVGEHDPAGPVRLALVVDHGGTQREHALDLLVAGAVGGNEVEMDAVLDLLVVGHVDEQQSNRPVGREDHVLLVARQIRVVGVLGETEQLAPPDRLLVGVARIERRMRNPYGHAEHRRAGNWFRVHALFAASCTRGTSG